MTRNEGRGEENIFYYDLRLLERRGDGGAAVYIVIFYIIIQE